MTSARLRTCVLLPFIGCCRARAGQGLESAVVHPTAAPVDIPDEYICPISWDIMRDPVKTCDAFTYDRKHIKQWFNKGHNTSPMTNLPLKNKRLTRQRQLRKQINKFFQENNVRRG